MKSDEELMGGSKLIRRPVIALGYQAPDGTIVVTDVLCMNFPDMTNEEMATLSWKLDQWSKGQGTAKPGRSVAQRGSGKATPRDGRATHSIAQRRRSFARRSGGNAKHGVAAA